MVWGQQFNEVLRLVESEEQLHRQNDLTKQDTGNGENKLLVRIIKCLSI